MPPSPSGRRAVVAASTGLLTVVVACLLPAGPATAGVGAGATARVGAADASPTPTPAPTPAPVPSPTVPPAPVPVPPVALPAEYDVEASYEGQAQCDPTPKPGAVRLARLLQETYGDIAGTWIPRDCSVGGQSEHKEGRAIDWMVSVRVPEQRAAAEAFLAWLTAPGPDGTPHAMARRLGVMYIGWNDRIWRGYDTDRGWAELKGCLAPQMQDRGQDTYCHRDHVHLSLTWDGASGRSSFWDGTALDRPYCPRAASVTASVPPLGATGSLTVIPAVRVLDSRTGFGSDAGACRLQQDRWTGDRHLVSAVVTGRGGVPAEDVAAVAIRATAIGSNAPAELRAWPAGTISLARPAVSVPMNAQASAVALVPVGVDGRVALATSAGATDIVVDVLGWVPGAPAGAPGDVAGSGGTGDLGAGGLVVGAPAKAYDSVDEGGDLQPGETRTVALAGRAGLPADGVSAVVLSVTPYGSARSGGVRVLASGAAATRTTASAFYPALGPRTTRVVTPVGSGAAIDLVNTGSEPVRIKVDVLGWTGPAAGGGTLGLMPLTPTAVLDTRTGLGGSGALGPGRTMGLPLAGVGGIPATARAVLLQVTTSGSSASGAVTAWPAGAENPGIRSVGVVAGRAAMDLLVLPLGADGATSWSSPAVTTHLRALVVGYLS